MDDSEILVAFGSSVAGAVVGAFLPLFLPKGANTKNTITGGRVIDSTVTIGDTVTNTHNRIVINSSVTTKTVRENSARVSANSNGGSTDEWGVLLTVGAGVILAVMAYLRYRSSIIAIILALAAFSLTLPLSALAFARLRAVSFGRTQTLQLLINTLLAIASLAGLYLLSDPPYGFNRSQLAQVLTAGRQLSFAELTQQFGVNWLLFLAYQLLGLAALVMAIAFIMLHSLKMYALVNNEVRQRADPTYRPGALSRWLTHRMGRSPTSVFVSASILTVLSLALVSGAGYALITHLNSQPLLPGGPMQTPPASPPS